MPSLLPLLLFCDFLENRLHTSNLSLLRRMLGDFFAGSEQTLQDFIRIGASIVTVMPIERKSVHRQQEAARLLTQQQNMKKEDSKQMQLCVFSYLSARVANRNILLLRSMFQEFCGGGDRLICEFVRRGNEVVSLIPADIQALQVPTSWAEPALNPDRELKQNDQQQRADSDADDSEDEDEIASVAELASVASMPPTRTELHDCIMEVLDRIEQQEPWKTVFNPETIPISFSGVKRIKLAAALKKFWMKNSRAVWERHFWGPLSNLPDKKRSFDRKTRQAKARESFTKVMAIAYEELGADFFVALDEHASLYKGWWYSGTVQRLTSLAHTQGLAACINYMETQALKRFPRPPGSTRRAFKPGESRSMWSTTVAMAPVLREICAIKANK
ncbi:hypothetical protein P3T76_012751 [Phytophthora citrophthora]|uniref:Uncharacterized protein n=1 Tax=Phytophthora citrophthora TaxID=4793 RepID=A0AAD9G4A0_9STRA|nr:hypothetical protein P3T76_012751 [Phytophthora citrophthora]